MLQRLQKTFILLTLLFIIVTGSLCLYLFDDYSKRVSEQNLSSAARLFSSQVLNGQAYEEAAELCVTTFDSAYMALRLTVIDRDGKVLFDSQSDIASMDNHAEREELIEVFATQKPAVRYRYSDTVGEEMMYYAVYHPSLDLVVRSSMPLSLLRATTIRIQIFLFLVMVCAVIVVAFAGFRMYRRIMKPLRQLQTAADAIANADYSARVSIQIKDELADVSIAFNEMARHLEDNVKNLEEKNEHLDALQKMRSDFAANVSHELKTPLTSIRGFVETLRRQDIKDKKTRDRFLDIIDIETERLYQLISDVLLLSEIEGMDKDVGGEAFDLSDVLIDVVALLRDKAKEKKVTLSALPTESLPVFAAEYRIRQILINLIDNAIKYNRPGGHVCVSASRRPDRMILIEVKDNGIGIEADHLTRVFERFYRVDSGRSRAEGGTGLGLSIVKHIAQLYDGRAIVESQLEKGSVFSVFLRIADDLKSCENE